VDRTPVTKTPSKARSRAKTACQQASGSGSGHCDIENSEHGLHILMPRPSCIPRLAIKPNPGHSLPMLRRLIAPLLAVAALCVVPVTPFGITAAHADPADIAAASRGVVRVVIVQSDGHGSSLIGHGTALPSPRNMSSPMPMWSIRCDRTTR
jgi:hypothetical protein